MNNKTTIAIDEPTEKISSIKGFLSKITYVAKDILDVYNSIRSRDPISIILGSLSAAGVLMEIFHEDKSLEDLLKEQGLNISFSRMRELIYSTLKNLDLQTTDAVSENSEGEKVEQFDIGMPVCFIKFKKNDVITGPYINDEDEFVKCFSNIIKEKMGDTLTINSVLKRWENIPYIDELDLSSDIYIGSINENSLLADIDKFHKKGYSRSILFVGPPGVGKSTLVSRMARKLGGRLLVINPKGIDSLGLDSFMDIINIIDPCIILFDDLDRVWKPEEMLGSVEQLNRISHRNKRIVIATVNNIDNIPEALKRPGRFDEIIEFKPPDKSNRSKIISAYAELIKVNISKPQISELSTMTNNMTGAFLKEIVLRISVLGFEQVKGQINQMRILSGLNKTRIGGSSISKPSNAVLAKNTRRRIADKIKKTKTSSQRGAKK